MKITTFAEDIDALLKNWSNCPKISKNQQQQWPKPLTKAQLKPSHPQCLRLLASDGGDDQPVWAKNINLDAFYSQQYWPNTTDIIRLGIFFHLEVEAISALLLKAQWETYFIAKNHWENKKNNITIALVEHIEEAKTLSIQFAKTYQQADALDNLYQNFQQTNCDYNYHHFKLLIAQQILSHYHLLSIHSAEFTTFISSQHQEIQQLQQASTALAENFYQTKQSWIAQWNQLEHWSQELEKQRLKNTHYEQQWIAAFGDLFLPLKEVQYHLASLQRQISIKKKYPDLKREEVEAKEKISVAEEQEALQRLQKEINFAEVFQSNSAKDDNDRPMSQKDLSEYEQECKKMLLKIHMLTHPDRIESEPFSESQKQTLRAYFEEVRQISKDQELNMNQQILSRLLDILTVVEMLWESKGVDINPQHFIRGNKLEEKIEWLNKEIKRIEEQITQIRDDLFILSNDDDILEKASILSSEQSIAKTREKMEQTLQDYQKQILNLEQQLEQLFYPQSIQSPHIH